MRQRNPLRYSLAARRDRFDERPLFSKRADNSNLTHFSSLTNRTGVAGKRAKFGRNVSREKHEELPAKFRRPVKL